MPGFFAVFNKFLIESLMINEVYLLTYVCFAEISPTKDNRNLPPEVAAIVDSTPELQGNDAKNRPDALPGLKG